MHDIAAAKLQNQQNMPKSITKWFDPDSGEVVEVTDDMRRYVDTYVSTVQAMVGAATLYVERKVDILKSAEFELDGTADAAALVKYRGGIELQLHDLKTGHNPVEAADNEQLMAYAYGVAGMINDTYGIDMTGSISRVRLVIHQPALGKVDEWECSWESIEDYITAIPALVEVLQRWPENKPVDELLHPGEKQCHYCPVKAMCSVLDKSVADVIAADFEDVTEPALTEELITRGIEHAKGCAQNAAVEEPNQTTLQTLGEQLSLLGMVEDWVSAKRQAAVALLTNGKEVPGWKMVLGKRGNRAWTDEEEAAKLLRNRKLKADQMYTKKLISPAQAQKLLKPAQYEAVERLVEQKEGSPSLAPITDKREALSFAPVANDFEDVSNQTTASVADLF
jgi:hypothetical protein